MFFVLIFLLKYILNASEQKLETSIVHSKIIKKIVINILEINILYSKSLSVFLNRMLSVGKSFELIQCNTTQLNS